MDDKLIYNISPVIIIKIIASVYLSYLLKCLNTVWSNQLKFNISTQSFWAKELDNDVIKLWVPVNFKVQCPHSPWVGPGEKIIISPKSTDSNLYRVNILPTNRSKPLEALWVSSSIYIIQYQWIFFSVVYCQLRDTLSLKNWLFAVKITH